MTLLGFIFLLFFGIFVGWLFFVSPHTWEETKEKLRANRILKKKE